MHFPDNLMTTFSTQATEYYRAVNPRRHVGFLTDDNWVAYLAYCGEELVEQ